MVITSAYVAVFIACMNPGSIDEACTKVTVPGFIDASTCALSVHRVGALMSASTEKHVHIDATCEAVDITGEDS
jgi:hypothetical protein